MKNLMLLGLFATLINTSVMAGEGNGGGVNGPDLKGTAIPVKMDRDILVTRVKAIAKQCSEEFAANIFEVIYGRKPRNVLPFYFSVEQKTHEDTFNTLISDLSFGELKSEGTRSTTHLLSGWANIQSGRIGIMREPNPVEYSARYPMRNLETNVYFKHSVLKANSKNLIPDLYFVPTAVDYTYDEFGEIISERLVAKEIKILNVVSEPLTLFNSSTGRQVALKIDTRPYVNCLLMNLQK